MKFRILNPRTWVVCLGCGTMQREYGIQLGIIKKFCPNCDDWQDHKVHYYEGDIIEVTD